MIRAMIDIETLGTDVDAAVLSVGCRLFDEHGLYPEHLHEMLELDNQLKTRSVTQGTFFWWLAQSDAARTAIADRKRTHCTIPLLHHMLGNLLVRADEVWARGIDFDLAILKHLFAEYGLKAPWRYTIARDSRTLLSLIPKDLLPDFIGVKHDALADADHEAVCVINALDHLNVRAGRAIEPRVAVCPGDHNPLAAPIQDAPKIEAMSTVESLDVLTGATCTLTTPSPGQSLPHGAV